MVFGFWRCPKTKRNRWDFQTSCEIQTIRKPNQNEKRQNPNFRILDVHCTYSNFNRMRSSFLSNYRHFVFVFRHSKTSENRTFLFGFWMFGLKCPVSNITINDCPKSKRVQILVLYFMFFGSDFCIIFYLLTLV